MAVPLQRTSLYGLWRMPDPHFLYVVMAVVVTGLVGWVVAVNVWAPKRTHAPPLPAPAPTSPGDGAA